MAFQIMESPRWQTGKQIDFTLPNRPPDCGPTRLLEAGFTLQEVNKCLLADRFDFSS